MRDRGASKWYSPSLRWRYRISVHCSKDIIGTRAQYCDVRFVKDKPTYSTDIRIHRRGGKLDHTPMMGLDQVPETVRKHARTRINETVRWLESH